MYPVGDTIKLLLPITDAVFLIFWFHFLGHTNTTTKVTKIHRCAFESTAIQIMTRDLTKIVTCSENY